MIVRLFIAPSFLLIGAAGVALISLAFALLVPEDKRDAVAWLGYGVFLIVFLVNFSNIWIYRPGQDGFDQQIPRLGILWIADLSFTVLALGGLWACIAMGLSFRIQLIYQLTLLFGLFVLVGAAGLASQHAGQVGSGEERTFGSLDAMREAVRDCEVRFVDAGAGFAAERVQFDAVSEGIRYLSPCDEPAALALDAELTALLRTFSSQLAAGAQPEGENTSTQAILARCQSLLQLRKQKHRC
jgi:hypothetical protein